MSAVNEKYTPEQVIAAIERSHGKVSLAAKALKCTRQTVLNYTKDYPQVKQALEDARELTLDIAEDKLFKAIQKGQSWAICFYLKTQGKKRGYIERQEHTGLDGEPLNVVITYADNHANR
jgi:hypothetical protein